MYRNITLKTVLNCIIFINFKRLDYVFGFFKLIVIFFSERKKKRREYTPLNSTNLNCTVEDFGCFYTLLNTKRGVGLTEKVYFHM